MQIGVIGVNHKSADLALRERLARICQRRLGIETSCYSTFSFVLLSTCNRIEIYFSSPDLAETHIFLLQIWRQELDEEFEHKIYSYFGRDCFFHLACVTAGMDSAIIAETEIQGQVRQAYESAKKFKYLPKELHFLFQKSLKIGKDVRSSLALKEDLPTLEEAIHQAATHLLGNLLHKKILFVGLSEINDKIFQYFKSKGFKKIAFCNRTLSKLENFAQREMITLLPWEELYRWFDYELAIFATRCPGFLLRAEQMSCHYSKEASPRLVIDLSVPRNVDPRIGRENIKLLNVDQLNRVINRKKKMKAAEMARIESQVILSAVDTHVEIFKLREVQRHILCSAC